MSTRSLKYAWASSVYKLGRDDGLRVRITITDACNMPDAVFAYRMLPVNPQTGDAAGAFDHICSPSDLEDYPEAAPIAGASPQWFRLAYVDVLVRSTAEAIAFLRLVRQDLKRLIATLNRCDALIPTGTGVIGTDVCTESSSSSSAAPESSDSSAASLAAVQSLTAYGTLAVGVGSGIEWITTGAGAGSGRDDANYATVTLRHGQASQTLVIQGFDFSALPADATIVGLEVTLYAREVAGGSAGSSLPAPAACQLEPLLTDIPGPPLLRLLTLHQPAIGRLTNYADEVIVDAAEFEAILTAGGEEVLWGFSHWTPTLVKAGEFGVSVVMGCDRETPLATAAVDGAAITVYYRES